MNFNKVTKQEGVADQVYHALHQAILKKHLTAGEKLPSESTLCEQFGVSKASIKSALHRLSTLGLIETRVGQGSFVLDPNDSLFLVMLGEIPLSDCNVSHINEYRLYFEMDTVRLAMKRASDEDFRKCESILRRMDDAIVAGDIVMHDKMDYEFHLEICKATKNRAFVFAYETIGKLLRRHAARLSEGYFKKIIGQQPGEDIHWRLLDAIKAKDIDACRKCYLILFSVFETLQEADFLDC
ncbi:MAG: GntR family transcriptional regulator [Treponema sp.]|jgi:GntR family transcriptional repressor for pyruvate dehydrogenase complex|nr:GntR family transcriptional regulator [Treponema sp.]